MVITEQVQEKNALSRFDWWLQMSWKKCRSYHFIIGTD